MRRSTAVGLLLLVVVIAGCSAPPGSGPTPTAGSGEPGTSAPYFAFANNDTADYAVTVYLTEGKPTEFRVTLSSGRQETVNGSAIPWNATEIEPVNAVVASERYVVERDTNLFVELRGCTEDTWVWQFHSLSDGSALSFGPAYPCEGLTQLEFRTPNGGGAYVGGDYTHLLDDPATERRQLSAD